MKKMFVFLFISIISSVSLSQQFTHWRNYSDLKNINAFALSGDVVWAASSGGVFSYNFTNQSYQVLSKTNGLSGTSITAVTIDKFGKVWFGSANGKIDIYDPSVNSFKTILDIFTSDRTNKRINELRASGDTIFAATDFGISLINTGNYFFYDTYFKFGSFTSNTKVNSTLNEERIYSCTEAGLAISKINAVNLSAPESWTVYQVVDGLISNNIIKVFKYRDSLIVATDKGFSAFNGTSWQPFISSYNNKIISDVIVRGDTILILSQNIISSYSNGSLNPIFTSTVPIKKINYNSQLGYLAASTSGVINYSIAGENFLVPNGPAANKFRDIRVDRTGALWSATGKDNGGVGFFKFENDFWRTYNNTTNPEIISNDYYSIHTAPDNAVYIGNWGSGFARYKNGIINSFNASNTDLKGITDNPQFIVITAMNTDSRNNLWILNYESAERKTLSMLTTDSTWYHFPVAAEQNRILAQKFHLVIDAYNTKWYSCIDPLRTGLLYFNENNTYSDLTDDRSGFLTTTNGLNSNNISALAVDRRGDLWIGTGAGVNILSNNQSALNQSNPQFRINSVFLLRQQSINAIVVDPLNQKWIATNQGLLLVNADGTRLIAAFDSRNSSLISDQIKSLAIDENTGTVFAGTDEGLTSFRTISIKPVESFSELFVYPSPYILNTDNTVLTIDGLIRDTDIKILSISGKLVREFSSPGGRIANWDGRDDLGNFVSSGIYVIVAYDKEGSNVTSAKVAVLRD